MNLVILAQAILVLALTEALKDPGWLQQADESVRECGKMLWMGPSGEMGGGRCFSSGAWCGGEDRLPRASGSVVEPGQE